MMQHMPLLSSCKARFVLFNLALQSSPSQALVQQNLEHLVPHLHHSLHCKEHTLHMAAAAGQCNVVLVGTAIATMAQA